MAADTYDPVLGLILQGTGNNNNAWGTINNLSMITLAARATAGMVTRAVTGGTLDLSGSPPPATARQDIHAIQYISGTLSSHQTIIVPSISKTWIFYNGTSGAFQLFVKTAAGATAHIPQGSWKMCWSEGSGVYRMDDTEIGNLVVSARPSAGPGELACSGQSLLRADYPNLFAKIGGTWGAVDGTHFTLPDYTTGSRFLRSSGAAGAVGTYQGAQMETHSHTVTGSPSLGSLSVNADGNHSHYSPMNDPTHAHGVNGGTYGGTSGNWINYAVYWYGPISATAIGINGAYTGVYVSGEPGAHYVYYAGTHGHGLSGSPAIGSLGTANAGVGSETRPVNAVVLMCIKF